MVAMMAAEAMARAEQTRNASQDINVCGAGVVYEGEVTFGPPPGRRTLDQVSSSSRLLAADRSLRYSTRRSVNTSSGFTCVQLFVPRWTRSSRITTNCCSAWRELDWGAQPTLFGAAQVWILPNPSGRNRSFTLAALVIAYRELRVALP